MDGHTYLARRRVFYFPPPTLSHCEKYHYSRHYGTVVHYTSHLPPLRSRCRSIQYDFFCPGLKIYLLCAPLQRLQGFIRHPVNA